MSVEWEEYLRRAKGLREMRLSGDLEANPEAICDAMSAALALHQALMADISSYLYELKRTKAHDDGVASGYRAAIDVLDADKSTDWQQWLRMGVVASGSQALRFADVVTEARWLCEHPHANKLIAVSNCLVAAHVLGAVGSFAEARGQMQRVLDSGIFQNSERLAEVEQLADLLEREDIEGIRAWV